MHRINIINRTKIIDAKNKIDYNLLKGGENMIVTATEFKLNMGKYLEMVQQEDITITKNGKKVGVLVNPGVNTVRNLRGIIQLPEEVREKGYRELKSMRVEEKYENND